MMDGLGWEDSLVQLLLVINYIDCLTILMIDLLGYLYIHLIIVYSNSGKMDSKTLDMISMKLKDLEQSQSIDNSKEINQIK